MAENGTSKLPAPTEGAHRGHLARALTIYAVILALMIGVNARVASGARHMTLLASGVILTLLGCAWLVYWRVFQRRMRRFMVENVRGVAAIGRGELEVARDLFWHWAEHARGSRASAIARHNLGWTLMRQGELQHSIDVLADNDARNGRALQAVGLAATTAVDLALDHFLLGDVMAGERWMAETAERARVLAPVTLPAMQAFARAVCDCRAGRRADAARLLDERWAEYEAALTGDILRPLRVVRAFVTDGGPREAGVVEAALAQLRPTFPAEYVFLGVAWPEMAQFLISHGLARA